MTVVAVRPPDVPEIRCGTDIERMAREGIAALAEDPTVYQRAGRLVKVITIPPNLPPTSHFVREPGTPIMRVIEQATLRGRLTDAARWLKLDGQTKEWKISICPEVAVSRIMAAGEWPKVRPLIAIITTPCMRPDGSIIEEPGYDAATSMEYRPREAYVGIGDAPTHDDAMASLAVLREVFCDFPFAEPRHESAALAAILTMLARPAIRGSCPLFAVDATTRGTGKGRLVDACTHVAQGFAAAKGALPDDDDEMRKRITSMLMEGDTAICLDNAIGKIKLPSLDLVLTTNDWKDRALGKNETVSVPSRAVWFLTGNNLQLAGDLGRRTLLIRLESPLENPESRNDFRHPHLLRWIDENRKRLVGCALTMLRAYWVAGRPAQPGCGLLGSFEEWSEIIPPVLVWLGLPSPTLTIADADPSADTDRDILSIFMAGLSRLLGTTEASSKEIVDQLFGTRKDDETLSSLREVVEEISGHVPGKPRDTKKLSYYLRAHRGRVVGGRRLERGTVLHQVSKWMVKSVEKTQ